LLWGSTGTIPHLVTNDGTTPWGPSVSLDMTGNSARWIMFDNFVDYGANFTGLNEVEVYKIPEPSTVVLLLMGLVGLAVVAWRRRK